MKAQTDQCTIDMRVSTAQLQPDRPATMTATGSATLYTLVKNVSVTVPIWDCDMSSLCMAFLINCHVASFHGFRLCLTRLELVQGPNVPMAWTTHTIQSVTGLAALESSTRTSCACVRAAC